MEHFNTKWMENKLYMGKGCYRYKCKYIDCSNPRK